MKKTLHEHLDPQNGRKRILSLDGGGIRGALTLGYLKKIETILRTKENDQELLLCDYFDLIGGTSTGSIIASALAIGKSVDEIAELYMKLGGEIFGEKKKWYNPLQTWQFLKAKYDYQALEDNLKAIFGDITLESDQIKTGLCIVAKRADTNSTWPLINHPKGKFFNTQLGKNKNIPLWQAVRASSAAPTYFVPQMIDVGDGQRAAFIDGGVSTANNPALTLLMVATLKGFPFRWKMSAEDLAIVSVGTGYSVFKKKTGEITNAWIKTWAESVPDMLMQDASWQNQIMMQWLSDSPTAHYVDMEIEYLKDDYIGMQPQLKYLRYNFPITINDLNNLKISNNSFTEKDVDSLIEMSNAQNREILYKIGKVAGEKEIKEEHFNF